MMMAGSGNWGKINSRHDLLPLSVRAMVNSTLHAGSYDAR